MTYPANPASPVAIILIDPATGLPYAASSGGATITSPNATINVGGTASAPTVDVAYPQTGTVNPAANTPADGLVLQDTVAATTGNQQFSPRLRLTGQGFATTPVASQTVDFELYVQPVQGAANPTSQLRIASQINGSGFNNQVTIVSNSGGVTFAGGIGAAGVDCSTAGTGFSTKEGANCKQGVSTLAAGTVVVANTSVTANSRIFITAQSLGTVAVPSAYGVSARTPGTSFTILASINTDTSVVAWEIFEPG